MKRNDKHELYCGCRECRRPEEQLPLLEKRPEPEKQKPPKEPHAVPPDGGRDESKGQPVGKLLKPDEFRAHHKRFFERTGLSK